MYSEALLDLDMYFFVHPSIELSRFKDERRRFIHSIDLAEGTGGDYTVLNFFEVLPMTIEEINNVSIIEDEYSFFKLVQVAMFRSNQVIVPEVAKWYYHCVVEIFIPDNVRAVLENNYDGNYFREVLSKLYGDENEIDCDVMFFMFPYNMKDDQSVAVRVGLKQNDHTKNLGTTMMKTQMRQKQLILTEYVTIEEALSFARKKLKNGFGGYCAMIGNDDCIMTAVNITHARKLPEFQELVDDVSQFCPKEFWDAVAERMKKIPLQSDDSGDVTSMFG